MNVAQLLDPLGLGPDIEIVISSLPERPTSPAPATAGLRPLRFGDQQMNVLRHHHISGDVEPVPLPRSFESSFEDVASRRRTQTRRTPVATKPEKVQTPRLLKSLEPQGIGKPSYADGKDRYEIKFPALSQKAREGRGSPSVFVAKGWASPPPGCIGSVANISLATCRIPVEPFDYVVKAGQPAQPERVSRVIRYAKNLQTACRFPAIPFD